MTPIPLVLGRFFNSGQDGFGVVEERTGFLEHFGAFLTSFMATIGLGILLLLAHSKIIGWKTFAFEISGGLVILLTIVVVLAISNRINKKNDDGF